MCTFVLTYYQVMPGFLDVLLPLFGVRFDSPSAFSGTFKRQLTLSDIPSAWIMPEMNRSGHQYELSYNLWTTDVKGGSPDGSEWRIRTLVVYHKFDILTGEALWFLVRPSLDVKELIESLTGPRGKLEDNDQSSVEACFSSSLSVHLTLVSWCASSWRFHLDWLDGAMMQHTRDLVYSSGLDGGVPLYSQIDVDRIDQFIERAEQLIAALTANCDNISSLQRFYVSLLNFSNSSLGSDAIKSRLDTLTDSLAANESEMQQQIARARRFITQGNTIRSRIAGLIATQDARIMQSLAISQYDIALSAKRDATAMRIVTIVTLIYLPATFTCTFFSTDIVKYQSPNSDPPNSTTSFSSLAMYRWLQVTLPLTFLTLTVSYMAFRMAEKKLEKESNAMEMPGGLLYKTNELSFTRDKSGRV